mgnify:FL=1
MYEVAFDGFDTVAEARIKLHQIADNIIESSNGDDEEDIYDTIHTDYFDFDVYTFRIVKTSSLKYAYEWGSLKYFTI